MTKMIEVVNCDKCPFFTWGDDVYPTCGVKERYDFEIEVEKGVQEWCPLKDENIKVIYNGD